MATSPMEEPGWLAAGVGGRHGFVCLSGWCLSGCCLAGCCPATVCLSSYYMYPSTCCLSACCLSAYMWPIVAPTRASIASARNPTLVDGVDGVDGCFPHLPVPALPPRPALAHACTGARCNNTSPACVTTPTTTLTSNDVVQRSSCPPHVCIHGQWACKHI
ncbi:hypothetical protein DFP73DRAFT_121138 [Morchella snyderi]|nr:hypothetical protein DFP73DRAFT_121138 [Morchella snyderi]